MNLTLNIELTTREITCIKYFNTQTLLDWEINNFDDKEIISLCDKGLMIHKLINMGLYNDYCLSLTELGLQCYEKIKNEM